MFDLDDTLLGATLADAYASRIQQQLLGISQRAKDSTLAFRAKAAALFAGGGTEEGRKATSTTKIGSWTMDMSGAGVMKRYAGGRTGAKAPNQSDKLFNDSGRLRESVVVMQNRTDNTFTVNVAANRLNPAQFGNGFDAMVSKLIELVPILDPKRAREDVTIENAIRQSVKEMMAKAESVAAAKAIRLKMQLRKARLQALGVFLPGGLGKIVGMLARL